MESTPHKLPPLSDSDGGLDEQGMPPLSAAKPLVKRVTLQAPLPSHAPPTVEAPQTPVNSKDVPKLYVQLLKERMELEVSLLREGSRAILFLIFCLFFCMSIYLHTQPHDRSDAVHQLYSGLGLADLEEVSGREEVFDAMIQISDAARKFFPLSSQYIADPLTKTLINQAQDFPRGPEALSGEALPELPIEWSITTRIRLANPTDSNPRRTSIIKEVLVSGQDLVCWALHCEGLQRFTLEYGQHSMDSGYKSVSVEFNRAKMSRMNMDDMNLVAMVVNSTHFTVMLQNADSYNEPTYIGQSTAALELGSLPSQCADGGIWVGDYGLELADMTFHPRMRLVTEFDDLTEGGQTLEDIASGKSRGRAPEFAEEFAQSQETDDVMDSVSRATERILGVVKTSSTISHPLLPPPVDSFHRNSTLGKAGDDGYLHIIGREPQSPGDVTAFFEGQLSEDTEAAFQHLRDNYTKSFTLSWWANSKATSAEVIILYSGNETYDKEPLSFVDTHASTLFLVGRLGTNSDEWVVEINGDKGDCQAAKDTGDELAEIVCPASPMFWCKGAPGRQHAAWRHIAVRYTYGDAQHGGYSEISLFQDGAFRCGQSFPSVEAAIPHLRELGPGRALSAAVFELNFDPSFLMKDLRLYPEALSDAHLKDLGRDPAVSLNMLELTCRVSPTGITITVVLCSALLHRLSLCPSLQVR